MKDATSAHHAMLKNHHSGSDTHIQHLKDHGHKVEEQTESASERKMEKKIGEKKAEANEGY